jgi:hypothetical protein
MKTKPEMTHLEGIDARAFNIDLAPMEFEVQDLGLGVSSLDRLLNFSFDELLPFTFEELVDFDLDSFGADLDELARASFGARLCAIL